MAKKSKTVSKAKQIKIAKYYLFKDSSSYKNVALRFNVTKDQVRNYVDKYRNEEYTAALDADLRVEFDANKDKVAKELLEVGANTLINETIVNVIAALRSRTDLEPKEQLDLVSKLTITMKRNQDMQFVDAVKKPDVQKIIELVRYFYPDATEKEILEAWKILELEN